MSKTRSRSSIAFLLCGPGIAVRIVGACGSFGKKGCSASVCPIACAVATLAAGFVVVVIGRAEAKRERGRRRHEVRMNEAMVEDVQPGLEQL